MTRAKKKAGSPVNPSQMKRYARIELPDSDFQRMKSEASRFNLGVSAYIRLSVMERIERDEAGRKRAS